MLYVIFDKRKRTKKEKRRSRRKKKSYGDNEEASRERKGKKTGKSVTRRVTAEGPSAEPGRAERINEKSHSTVFT